ncbi:MAG: GntR family transcriptional regulator, partial [Bryobacteraceae bacterium]|nr:GntR family transcriptional regulator [Bryobacteraceae bacterium]
LRLADNLPVIYERRYIVAEYCPELTRADLEGSLYAVWTQKYRLEIEGADERIRAVHLRGPEARALRVRDGAAGLLIRSVGYLTGGRPLWFERTLYRGDAYEFHNRLGGIQPASFAQGKFLDAGEAQS